MDRISLLAIFIVVFVAIGKTQPNGIPLKEIPADYGYIVKIGQQMPDIEMKLTDGTIVTTASLKGKVVMLQFTASWCGVCRREMPHIEKGNLAETQEQQRLCPYRHRHGRTAGNGEKIR